MGTTYRYSIQTDDFRLKCMMAPALSWVVGRRSDKADREARAAFARALAHQLPQGPKASARLEVSGRHGCQTLVRARGEVTLTRLGRGGYCQVPDRGRWVDEATGEVLALA